MRGQTVTLRIDAETREVVVYHQQQEIKRVPIKGLVGQRVPFATFVAQFVREACREQRLRWHQRRRQQANPYGTSIERLTARVLCSDLPPRGDESDSCRLMAPVRISKCGGPHYQCGATHGVRTSSHRPV